MSEREDLSLKTGRVLNIVLLCLIVILGRTWFLSVVKHDEYLKQSLKPQRHICIEKAERGQILDRYGVLLATNRIKYNASVSYAQIKDIPRFVWQKNEKGKKVRIPKRSDYIEEFSQMLSRELNLDPVPIKDLIYGEAALFPNVPFVIKENLTEEEYYRLKMLKKDWVGLDVQRSYERFYPKGRVASSIVGYMGAISEAEYRKILMKSRELKDYLNRRLQGETPFLPIGFNSPLEVKEQVEALEEKAYDLNDCVGKFGIEQACDFELRGVRGKKIYEVDVNGNSIRELPGAIPSIAGRDIHLSISCELQEEAEALLARYASQSNSLNAEYAKGGAIVAIIPNTGEVVAMASYPRFDPNDFLTPKNNLSVSRWLEGDFYRGKIWDGICMFKREIFDKGEFREQNIDLKLETYLQAILGPKSQIKNVLYNIGDLKTAVRLQREVKKLLNLSGQDNYANLIEALYRGQEHISSRRKAISGQIETIVQKLSQNQEQVQEYKNFLDRFIFYIPHNNDKLLLLDLCKIFVPENLFSDELLAKVGHQKISTFFALTRVKNRLQGDLYEETRASFEQNEFVKWREENFASFLKKKREIEKAKKRYQKPYTEYLEAAFKELFKEFWQQNKSALLRNALSEEDFGEDYKLLKSICSELPEKLSLEYLNSMRQFADLSDKLWGFYRFFSGKRGEQIEKQLAGAFYPAQGFSNIKSYAYQHAVPLGSIFKPVTAYEALKQSYLRNKERDLNPLTISDQMKGGTGNKQILGYFMNGQPIHRLYKGGRLPGGHSNIGVVDLKSALEQSSNLYFAILAGDVIDEAEDLAKAAKLFGFGKKTGVELLGEASGSVPLDIAHNKTGLYSFAIGHHTFEGTPLQASLMLSIIANGGKVFKPTIIKSISGEEVLNEPVFDKSEYSFKNALKLVGIDFPLFTEVDKSNKRVWLSHSVNKADDQIFLPSSVRNYILDGMYKVVNGEKGTARLAGLYLPFNGQDLLADYRLLRGQMVGKTGTAEVLHKQGIDEETKAELKNHVWFGAVSFPEINNSRKIFSSPDLVVVVYSQFGKSGKELAPLAARIIKKHRELCLKYEQEPQLK